MTSSTKPVFISYARRASSKQAGRLQQVLGENVSFLDTRDLEYGAKFPEDLTAAILGARIAVLFISTDYFKRWYCVRELRLALAPFEALASRGETNEQALAAALDHTIVVLPDDGAGNTISLLPPALSLVQWPRASETDAILELVNRTLQISSETLSERYSRLAVSDYLTRTLTSEASIPPAAALSGLCVYPRQLPASLNAGFVGRSSQIWMIDYYLRTLRKEAN